MKLRCAVLCGPGLVRTENQDNFYANGVYRRDPSDHAAFHHSGETEGTGLYAVADGMGGEAHGGLAALTAVQAMDGIKCAEGAPGMVRYLLDRNAAVCGLIREKGGARIGSTFVGLSINHGAAAVVNIGDSRAYLFRSGRLTQLSRDHTPVRQMVDLGVIKAEEARTHPDRHKLSQHLGIFPSEMVIEPYVAEPVAILSGDIFLLCSDGLTEMLPDEAIRELLLGGKTPEEKGKTLTEQAMKKGGGDNITVVLVQVLNERREPGFLQKLLNIKGGSKQ